MVIDELKGCELNEEKKFASKEHEIASDICSGIKQSDNDCIC